MPSHADPKDTVRGLGLDDPARYTATMNDESLRWSPSEAESHAYTDYARYNRYTNRSCDLTMRGGTTSGVIYPLSVCSLAEHYVFRSIGGASAGAIAASATAAAEHGRLADQPESVPEGSVRPGFAGLAGLVDWLISGTGEGRWRLAQLFQPNKSLHRVFRLATALMQQPETTGRNRYTSVLAALLLAVTPAACVALVALFLAWFAGPLAAHAALPPPRWNDAPLAVGVLVAALAAVAGGWVVRLAAARLKWAALALPAPLLPWAIGLIVAAASDTTPASLAAWLIAFAAGVFSWLLLTFAAITAYAAIYGKACWPLIAHADKIGFGMVPGARPYEPNWADRLAGMPRSTGVPPLSVWLADRIDDLAGHGRGPDGERGRALTFGDLWLGPDVDRDDPEQRARLPHLWANSGERVTNLVLMTTDVSGGRPYRMPFDGGDAEPDRWQFCAQCLDPVVPQRVVTQLRAAGTADAPCPRHPDETLYWLPDPWDVPVLLGTRMSLALPGLISAVPLCRNGNLHWFSDGGITSNFPIHFFDALLPRWPTFGLNLDRLDSAIRPADEVALARQCAEAGQTPWFPTGTGIASFIGRIFETFLGWRDTMQSAMPGFRGRIANVRQGLGEGGTNLLMTPDVIATLALRGHKAGELLKETFTRVGADGEADGFTQTDRYRWIRMRIALREYRELTRQAQSRAPLYVDRASRYLIPGDMAGWFTVDDGRWPKLEPDEERINETFARLGELANVALAEPFDGTPPINPDLRLTPPE